MTGTDPCPQCNGRGWTELGGASAEQARVCGMCSGRGVTPGGARCAGCHGTGRIEVRTVEQARCWRCNGTGRYPVPEAL